MCRIANEDRRGRRCHQGRLQYSIVSRLRRREAPPSRLSSSPHKTVHGEASSERPRSEQKVTLPGRGRDVRRGHRPSVRPRLFSFSEVLHSHSPRPPSPPFVPALISCRDQFTAAALNITTGNSTLRTLAHANTRAGLFPYSKPSLLLLRARLFLRG